MKEQLINDLILELKNDLEVSDLNLIKNKLSVVLNNYEVHPVSTEVALYNGLPRCYENYIATRMIEGLSKTSIKLYELRLRQFFTAVNKDINNITANDIRVFLFKYQESNQVSNRTLDSIRTILCTFFGWANAEGYCDKNPCLTIKKIKYQRKQKEAMSELELEKMRNACNNIRESALLEFMYSTGARVSEVCDCKISDVDFEHREVTLLGKGNKYRIDYLNAKTEILLKEYLDNRKDTSPYLFVSEKGSRKLTKSGIESIIDRIWKRTTIEKKVTPHVIRHTTATLALKRGMSIEQVQKVLGHTNINTTMIYAEVMKDKVKQSHSVSII